LIKYYSNSAEIFQQISNKLNILRETDRVIRVAAFDAWVRITDRIQQLGLKTDGTPIGKYSIGYAAKRKKEGRQVNFIDLTMYGDMFDNFGPPAPAGKNEYEIGFRNKESGDKAEWMEARFGEIFPLTDNELEANTSAIQKEVDEILR
jgi:hypothetical protein